MQIQIQIQIKTEMHACAMFAFIIDMYLLFETRGLPALRAGFEYFDV